MQRPLLLLIAILLAACEPSPPRYRFHVPGPEFREEMIAEVIATHPDSIVAGEWVTLHASRNAGPWVVADSAGEADAPCQRISPVAREFEVASKVRWQIQPSEGITFNIPGPPDFLRQIRFATPGRYELTAVSEGCLGEFTSNRVVVVVR